MNDITHPAACTSRGARFTGSNARLALAWSSGASCGLLVGTILGSALGDLLQAHAGRQHAKALAGIPAQRARQMDDVVNAARYERYDPEQERHTSPGGGLPCQRPTPHESGHGCHYVHTWAPDGRHDDDREDD